MKAVIYWLSGILLLMVVIIAAAQTPERVLWEKRPIKVHIQTGQERIIHFPDEVRYWLPDTIKFKVSVIAANGVLYIKALDDFSSTRIRVQSLSDKQVYLLDISASDAETVSDELIVMTQGSVHNLSEENPSSQIAEDWRIRLTRYAAQQLYAPERLLGGDAAIKRIPLKLSEPVSLIRGGLLEAEAIASWQGNGLTVTAVRLRNVSSQSLRLLFEPSDSLQALDMSELIRGDWLTATLQHDFLGPIGNKNDTTTLYMVSNRNFIESLNLFSIKTPQSVRPAMYPKDEQQADG